MAILYVGSIMHKIVVNGIPVSFGAYLPFREGVEKFFPNFPKQNGKYRVDVIPNKNGKYIGSRCTITNLNGENQWCCVLPVKYFGKRFNIQFRKLK